MLNFVFDSIKIPLAVWEEITRNKNTEQYQVIYSFFKDKTREIIGFNELSFIMDYGESESVILYNKLETDFLLIDDKKARKIAENLGIRCIGTIGLLSVAKEKKIISELKPLFITFLQKKRFYSVKLLNIILENHNEKRINYNT